MVLPLFFNECELANRDLVRRIIIGQMAMIEKEREFYGIPKALCEFGVSTREEVKRLHYRMKYYSRMDPLTVVLTDINMFMFRIQNFAITREDIMDMASFLGTNVWGQKQFNRIGQADR
jgi:hypothetical protein